MKKGLSSCAKKKVLEKEKMCLGIGKVIVKEASQRYLPSTASSADNDTVTNKLNTTQSQVTTVKPPTEVLSISLISLSVAVVFNLGVCMLLIIYKSHNKRKRKQNDTNQQSDAEIFQMSPQNDPSYESASQDVIMGSENTNVCLHMTKGNVSLKEQNSLPGNQSKLESAHDERCKEDDSTGQENPCRNSRTTHHSVDSGENKYCTLEGPREDHKYQPLVSTPSCIKISDSSGSTEDKQYEIMGLDDQHTYEQVSKEDGAGQEISCRNSPTTHYSADSGENMYFTLEGPSEDHKYQPRADLTSRINASDNSYATKGKQYETTGLDDQHTYEQVNKEYNAEQENSCRNSSTTHHSADSGENKYFTLEGPSEDHKCPPQADTTSRINPSDNSDATEGKQCEIMDLDDQHLYAQVNNKVKSDNGTPKPDSLFSASESKDCRNVESTDLYAELNKPGKSNGATLQDNLPTRSVKLHHMESPKRQDLEDNGDGSTYDKLTRPLYEGPHSISE